MFPSFSNANGSNSDKRWFWKKMMNKLFALIGATLGGWTGWWLGEQVGLMTAFMLSIIGSAGGIYFARRYVKDYLS